MTETTDTGDINVDPFLTVQHAADLLSLSRATVYRMMYARSYSEQIKAGKKTLSDVPKDVLPYLSADFPPPIKLGPRITRFRRSALLAWMASKETSEVTRDNGLDKTAGKIRGENIY